MRQGQSPCLDRWVRSLSGIPEVDARGLWDLLRRQQPPQRVLRITSGGPVSAEGGALRPALHHGPGVGADHHLGG